MSKNTEYLNSKSGKELLAKKFGDLDWALSWGVMNLDVQRVGKFQSSSTATTFLEYNYFKQKLMPLDARTKYANLTLGEVIKKFETEGESA